MGTSLRVAGQGRGWLVSLPPVTKEATMDLCFSTTKGQVGTESISDRMFVVFAFSSFGSIRDLGRNSSFERRIEPET